MEFKMGKGHRRIVYTLPLLVYLISLAIVVPVILCSSEETIVKWTVIGALSTIVGLCIATFVGTIAIFQFMQSQQHPALKLLFADTLSESSIIKVPAEGIGIHNIELVIANSGSSIAIWWEVIVDITDVPWRTGCTAAFWAQEAAQYESTKSSFIIRSFGQAAVYISAPLRIGTIQCFNCLVPSGRDYSLKYQINGDWGPPKTGSLILHIEPV